MSLSASTISLFVLLIPGLIFRFAVFLGSPIKRPVSSGNSLFYSITIVFFSVTIHIISYVIFIAIILPLINLYPNNDFNLSITQFGGVLYIFENNKKFTILKFLIDHNVYSISYFLYTIQISGLLAYLSKELSFRSNSFGRLLYGPLAPLINTNFDILTCFVLTKINHEERHVAYAGFAIEISLKDGSNIDHVVLQDPEKFFIKMIGNWPKTTFNHSRMIASEYSSTGLMYISGEDIQNVHFESWPFS